MKQIDIVRKIVWMMALCLMGIWSQEMQADNRETRVESQERLPQWAQDLVRLNPGVIDSVCMIPVNHEMLETMDMSMADIISHSYMIYYHQPRKHSEPQGEQFLLWAAMTISDDADPTQAMNHMYIGGYAIPTWWLKNPDMYWAMKPTSMNEIAKRYHGNYICPEYRYFQNSAPMQCYEKLEDLRSEEAAEDFHNLIEALKKVMKGKWAVSGVSKGGEAALLQHAFHPEDADVYVPYVAPFFNTNCDTVMQHYWLTNGWNQEFLDMFMNIRRTFTSRMKQIYPLYSQLSLYYNIPESKIYPNYLAGTAHFGFEEHAYMDTTELNDAIQFNGDVMYLHDVQGYNDSVYAIMLIDNSFKMKHFPERISVLRGQQSQMPERRHLPSMVGARPRSVTEAEWWGNDSIGKAEQAYEYQSKVELGYYDLRFDDIVGPEVAPSWNAEYKKYVGNLRDYNNPYYKDFPFDESLYNLAVTTTQNATKPIIFIYGEDDAWTGAAMKDEYINGLNVQKFILPGQNHHASFSSNTDMTKCNAIRALLDEVFGEPQGITEVQRDKVQSTKVIKNGVLYLMYNGTMYNVQGKRVH